MASEAGWTIEMTRARCPLCGDWFDLFALDTEEALFPYHWVMRSPGSCDSSGKTFKEARSLDTLRQRAHP